MRDELDQILDQAIKAYAGVEPSPELTVRILRQAQREPSPRHNRWRLALAIATPLAAALALAVVFAGRMSLPASPAPLASQPPALNIEARTSIQPPETLATSTSIPASAHPHAHPARAARSWARSLPAPYSKEELALMNFVQHHPKEAAEIAETQKSEAALTPPQPLKIAPLKTAPITIPALN